MKGNSDKSCQCEGEKEYLKKPAGMIMLLRRFLAEPSEDEDDPYQRSTLRFYGSKEVINFLNSLTGENELHSCPVSLIDFKMPPLKLDIPWQTLSTAELAQEIEKRVNAYRKEKGFKPEVIFCPDAGILTLHRDPYSDILPLQNKVALVTGSAGAIGSGICETLINKGCRVAVSDLPGAKLEKLVKELNDANPGKAAAIPMDVTDKKSVADAFAQTVFTWGGLDMVVINAGIAMVACLEEMELEAFRELEKVNVEGTLLVLAEAGRCLSLQGLGGDIVLISTKNVFAPGANFGAYSATKAAAHQLCRIASIEFAPAQIRVNMVAPDAIFSHGDRKSGLWEKIGPDRMRKRGLDEKGLEEYYRSRNLLQAKITARHVANAVLFFVTRQTPTTGATIPVDGGLPDAVPR